MLPLALLACTQPEWEEIAPRQFRKMLGFGDNDLPVGWGRYAELGVDLKVPGETLSRCSAVIEVLSSEVTASNCRFIRDEVARLSAGDSMVYTGVLADFDCPSMLNIKGLCPSVGESDHVMLTLAVRAVYDSASYRMSPRFHRLLLLDQEAARISEAMREWGVDEMAEEWMGLRYHVLIHGEGPSARQGEEVVLAYRGMYLDGEVFDDASDSLSWLYYPYGKPDQVIRGIELAVSHMQPGERRMIWLTSDLAFGERGSEGIVAPNTPVAFELTLVEVIR